MWLDKFYNAPRKFLEKTLARSAQGELMFLAMIWTGGILAALAFSGNIIGTLLAAGVLILLLEVLSKGDPTRMVKKYIKEKTKPKSMLEKSKKMNKWK